jgi:conjugative transfer signal peptidase TraF
LQPGLTMTTTGLFDRIRGARAAPVKRLALVAAGVLVGTFQLCGLVGLRINASLSLPVGLYVTSSRPEANLVEFCLPEPFASFAISRGYRDSGSCRDGAAPLMKPVVARAGHVVELSDQGIAVNGRLLPNTAPRAADSQGRPLTPWPFGRYVVAPDTVWVASSHHPRSFDSRYFGPVPTSSIRDHVRPLLTAW